MRRLLAGAVLLVGTSGLNTTVDATPYVGSPQIDYPLFNMHWSFAANLVNFWFVSLTFAACAALASLAWSGAVQGPRTLGLARDAVRAWLLWFIPVFIITLAGFLAWGTMGPLGVRQPIFRFAFVEAGVTASVLTLLRLGWRVLLARLPRPRAGLGFVQAFLTALPATCGLPALGLALILVAMGAPVLPVLAFDLPMLVASGLMAVLIALARVPAAGPKARRPAAAGLPA